MAGKKKKKTARRLVSFIICAALLTGIVFMVLDITKEVKTTFTLRADLKEAQAERDALLKEKQQLTEQKEKLENDDYVIAYARGQYLLTREGEQVIILPRIESEPNN